MKSLKIVSKFWGALQYDSHFHTLNPLLDNNPRETMRRVGAVLAFVSCCVETHIDANSHQGADNALSDYSSDELYGLLLICRTLMRTLEHEPTPTTGFG